MEFTDDLVRKLKYIIAGSDAISDSQIAKALGISRQAYSRRRQDNSVPIKAIVMLCLKKNISINYVLSKQPIDKLKANTNEMFEVVDNTALLLEKIL